MTPEAQRIAIVEACGWVEVNTGHWIGINRRLDRAMPRFEPVPDPLNDLNACHEMEKVLTDEQCDAYGMALTGVMSDAGRSDNTRDYCDWHATAPQRCEAFLKTLNLWRES